MEGPGSTLVDGRLASDFINTGEDPLHEPSAFVTSIANSVSEISFIKSDEVSVLSVRPDYSRTLVEGGLSVAPIIGQDEAQLELAVEDDGVVEDGDEELGQEGRIPADDEDDDQAYIYVNNSRSGMQTFDDGLLQAGNLIYTKMENHVQESGLVENRHVEEQDTSVTETATDNTILQMPVLASTPSSSAGGNSTTASFPLGSSKNPIRIIQQGNKYTSMQQLTSEQLSQIMQVCVICDAVYGLGLKISNLVAEL
jgi:hypothetical protein